jgi:dynein heavy chain 1
MPRGTSVASYIANLASRLHQLDRIATSSDPNKGVWLGGLFQPEAYVTATRQAVAHQKGWSLEQLVLSVDIEETGGAESFVIEGEWGHGDSRKRLEADGVAGLKLEGAAWENGRLALNDGQSTTLGPSQITWRKADASTTRSQQVNVPVYLNGDRADVLFSVDLETGGLSQAVVAQRGACLTAA